MARKRLPQPQPGQPEPIVLGTDKPAEVVLGGTEDTNVDAADLFPNIRAPLGGDPKGPTSLDFWRQAARDESDERESLIRKYLGRQDPSF